MKTYKKSSTLSQSELDKENKEIEDTDLEKDLWSSTLTRTAT